MIPRYSRPDMVKIWSPETKFRIWYEIEAHACDAMAEIGVIPEENAKAVWKAKDVEFDVFWNSISFQVMDIDVAKNYLKIINKQTKKFICLKNKIDDNDKSILSKNDYIQLLSNFDLVHFDKSEAQAFSKDKEIFNMIFKRNTNG